MFSLNCPFLLSKRRRIELEGGMAAVFLEISSALYYGRGDDVTLQVNGSGDIIRQFHRGEPCA